MDPEVAQYWADLFKELTETETWKTEYLEKNMLLDAYLGPEEFTQWMAEETEATEALAEEMGLTEASS
jgi:putative tricarboxylic transport membrane protein